MLKFFRVLIAIVVFVSLSIFFLDFTETVPMSLHSLAHLQIVSLIQARMVPILFLWFILTMLLGRIYCSVCCPLGILQDIVSRIANTFRWKKAKYLFHPEMVRMRWFFLLLFIAGLAAAPIIVSLLDPYSNFGKIMTFLVRPIYLSGNNILAGLSSDRFDFTAVSLPPIPAVLFALFTAFLVGALASFFGRRFCNTICPVGTLLGLFAKIAPFRIRLNSNCISCGLCEKVCKGECIDPKAKTVDISRCVDCFNCLRVCRKQGISFSQKNGTPALPPIKTAASTFSALFAEKVPTLSPRRTFLQRMTALLLFGSAASAATPRSGLPTGQSRITYKRNHPVLPPGAREKRHFLHHCTACQLCVAKCPANVLQPSITDLGLQGFLAPVLNFDYGFCNYHCVICTQVCPTRALAAIESETEKHKLQIGRVVFLEENCVVITQETNCGACAEHCPTGAITMHPHGEPGGALTLPVIDEDLCVGCGACENICPVVRYKAVYIEGLEKHGMAKPAYDPNEKQQEVQLDSFGF